MYTVHKDSEASPFIEQKGVILCRSGIQLYHADEVEPFITEDNKPPRKKEWYREMRPACVVVRAKKLVRNLPVTKEHPESWVTPDNWKILAGGTTGKEVTVEALEGDAEGEVGLKSDITFYDADLYDYFKDNREVSLGYTCKKHFVDNPEEVGYDIILDEITEVNHLAITGKGRGGSSVSVIDSLIGGMKPMRTGIFSWLKRKAQKDSEREYSFGKEVFSSLKKCKGEGDEKCKEEMKTVFDSLAELKDSEGKTTLVNMVKDCYDSRDKALANEEELTKAFDSMYVSISGDCFEEIVGAIRKVTQGMDGKDLPAHDSKEEAKEGKEEAKEGKEEAKEGKEEAKEGKEEAKEGKDGCRNVSDSSPLTRSEIENLVKDSVAKAVPLAVKEALGIKDGTEGKEGYSFDTSSEPTPASMDYTEFLE